MTHLSVSGRLSFYFIYLSVLFWNWVSLSLLDASDHPLLLLISVIYEMAPFLSC